MCFLKSLYGIGILVTLFDRPALAVHSIYLLINPDAHMTGDPVNYNTRYCTANKGILANKRTCGLRHWHSLQCTRVQITTGACEKVASDLGLGGGFCQLLRFHPPFKNVWQKK